jgi:hypothetical protein
MVPFAGAASAKRGIRMVQDVQGVATEEELDARLADLLHQMREQHVEQVAD